MAEKNMNAKISVEFEETANRQQLSSGDNLPTLFGKIKKFFTDLKPVALSGSYSDLSDKPKSFPANGGNADTVNMGFVAIPSDSSITLHWNAVEGIDKFRIQKLKDDGAWSTIVYPESTELSYCDTNLINGQSYSYRLLYHITEADGNTWSQVGNQITATPCSEGGFYAIPLDTGILLYWKPVSDTVNYRIQKVNDSGDWETLTQPSSAELSYYDSTATSNKNHSYRLLYNLASGATPPGTIYEDPNGTKWGYSGVTVISRASTTPYNIKGDAGTVNGHTVEADVPADAKFTDTIPEIPTSLPANGGNADTINKGFMAVPLNGAVILYWNKIDGAEKYRIQRRLESDTSLSTIVYPSATTFSYCDTGVTNGTTYVYRLLYAVGETWTTVANVTVHPSAMTYTAPKATSQSDIALTPTTSCLRQLASGTADPTTTTCPEGAWYGKHV